jgi:hypothetical protein
VLVALIGRLYLALANRPRRGPHRGLRIRCQWRGNGRVSLISSHQQGGIALRSKAPCTYLDEDPHS